MTDPEDEDMRTMTGDRLLELAWKSQAATAYRVHVELTEERVSVSLWDCEASPQQQLVHTSTVRPTGARDTQCIRVACLLLERMLAAREHTGTV